ncbi:MAG: amidohydrolase family protein [Oscillospiraceae bacterium]|nr:amidohydrolase family protein [Oscillospiraceae bacterium]
MKILIKNGTVYNGTGEAPEIEDVLIEGSAISRVGKNLSEKGCDRVVDAAGCSVAPGFIDAHSHNDFFVTRDDSATAVSPFLKQGITTQVVGNCGFSVIGVDPETEHKRLIGGGLFHTDRPMPLKQWVAENEGRLDLNVVPLVGHGSARTSVSGYRNGPLADDEKQRMLALLEQDMKDGAWGGSFGLMYEPGMYARREELSDFAAVIKKYDGILTVHPRACSDVSNGFSLLRPHHLELGLREVTDIMEKTGVRTEYSHLIFTGTKSWPRLSSMLGKIHAFRDRGFEIGYDMYSYTYGASVITVLLPPDFMAAPKEKRAKGFTYRKARMLMSLTKVLLGLSFSDMVIAYIGRGYEKYEGRALTDIAREEGLPDTEMYLKLVELSGGQGRIYLDSYYNDEIIETLMRDDLSIFMTDAWYEDNGLQNSSAYTCYPRFFQLARKYGIPTERIIRKMTGQTADRYHLERRGYLKEGYAADVIVFKDWEITAPTESPRGIAELFVNGVEAVRDDGFIDCKAGKFILKGRE